MYAEKPGLLQYSQASLCQRPGVFLADVHLKVGAKMSDAVEIGIFALF